jgi:hypothetical protein
MIRLIFLCLVTTNLMLAIACERSYGRQACRMENEVVLAESSRPPYAVAISGVDEQRHMAAWSIDGSTWVAMLDSSGVPLKPPVRIARGVVGTSPLNEEPRPGKTFWPQDQQRSVRAEDMDIAVLAEGSSVLAMLELPLGEEEGGAYLVQIPASGVGQSRVLRLGPVGEYATRITLAAVVDGVIVAWHEGVLPHHGLNDTSDLRLAFVKKEDSAHVESSVVVAVKNAAASPALATSGDGALLAWTEISHHQDGVGSLIKVASVSKELELGGRFLVAKGRFLESSPALVPVGDGFGIVFRDDADEDDTPEFYFSLLDKNGRMLETPRRISQADGLHGPALVKTGSTVISATIRSFQRNLLIGLNRFNTKGVKLGGEFQVYADKTDFIRVDLAALADKMVMIYAEDRGGKGRVLTGQVLCDSNR